MNARDKHPRKGGKKGNIPNGEEEGFNPYRLRGKKEGAWPHVSKFTPR